MTTIKESSFVCETTHFTDFAPFFHSGASVLVSSNYNIWHALKHVKLASLGSNIGFFVVYVYWGCLLILGVLCSQVDRSKLKPDFFTALYLTTHPPVPETSTQEQQKSDIDSSEGPMQENTPRLRFGFIVRKFSIPNKLH